MFNAPTLEAAKLCIDHYPPHQVVDAYGNAHGYAIDFVKRVMDAINEPLEIEIKPSLEQCIWLARQGKIDVLMGLYKTPDREAFMDLFKFSDGYSRTLFISLEHAPPVTKLQDLKGRKVGVIRGYHYFEAFDQYPDLERVAHMHLGQLLQVLRRGEVDYIAVSQYLWLEVEPSLKADNIDYRIAKYQPSNDQAVYLGVVRRAEWQPDRLKLKQIVERLYQERAYGM